MGGRPDLRAAYLLTAATAALTITVSAVGVFATDWLYRDNALVTATFRGQDMVTLGVAVPLLLNQFFLLCVSPHPTLRHLCGWGA